MEFVRSGSELPVAGRLYVQPPFPPHFFQVMSLLHARLVSEGVVNWAGSIHFVRVGTTPSPLDIISLTKNLISEFDAEMGQGNGRSLVEFIIFIFGSHNI